MANDLTTCSSAFYGKQRKVRTIKEDCKVEAKLTFTRLQAARVKCSLDSNRKSLPSFQCILLLPVCLLAGMLFAMIGNNHKLKLVYALFAWSIFKHASIVLSLFTTTNYLPLRNVMVLDPSIIESPLHVASPLCETRNIMLGSIIRELAAGGLTSG